MTTIRFHGVAAYEITNNAGRVVWIDPFLDENPGAVIRSDDIERVDLIMVSHAAPDHLGDTEKIARRTGAPILCGGDVKNYLKAKGIPGEQIQATVWGIRTRIAGFDIQPVECHHWSQIQMPDGNYITGVPLGFVFEPDPGVCFYHYGDTGIFSDLKLIGELYHPNIGALGITVPPELSYMVQGPGKFLTGEMTPREGVLAAEMLGIRVALPCHFCNPDNDDVREFAALLDARRATNPQIATSRLMKPGEGWIVQASDLV